MTVGISFSDDRPKIRNLKRWVFHRINAPAAPQLLVQNHFAASLSFSRWPSLSWLSPGMIYPSPGCAFALPPYGGVGRGHGEPVVLPHASAWPHSTEYAGKRNRQCQHAAARLQAFHDNGGDNGRSRASEKWQALPYRCRMPLVERRRRRRRRLPQQSIKGYGPMEDGGQEEALESRCSTGDVQQGQRRPPQAKEVLIPPSTTAVHSSSASGEDVVVLDDPFEELEGDRARHACVVHNTLAAGPTPYNDGWDWQKQVSGVHEDFSTPCSFFDKKEDGYEHAFIARWPA